MIDGAQQMDVTGVNNDTRTVDYVRLGVDVGPSGTSGTLFFDALESRRSTYIGQQQGNAAQSINCPDGAQSKAHAVVAAGASTFCYGQNGNMVRRTVGGQTYSLGYTMRRTT